MNWTKFNQLFGAKSLFYAVKGGESAYLIAQKLINLFKIIKWFSEWYSVFYNNKQQSNLLV